MLDVLINGSSGKMGTVLKDYIKKSAEISVKYEIDKNTPLSFNKLDNITEKPDVIIDFSIPSATFDALDYSACHLVPIVVATTGFTKEEQDKILEYSEAIPIFQSSNMSYSINLIEKILKKISPILPNMDIEILEKHHRYKKDAPSGTAISLANSINSACDNKYQYVFNRHYNNAPRNTNEIGFSSVRGGNIAGEHSVLFFSENESIEIKHTTYSRNIFAEGSVRAAKFIVHQKNGLYTMDDLIK